MVTYWWSRVPGKFLDKTNGNYAQGGSFTGTVREWYETLIEVMIDVENTVLRKSGLDSMMYMSWRADPVIYPIIESSVLHRPTKTDRQIGTIGSVDVCGLVRHIPIRPISYLNSSGVLQFLQFEGSEAQVVHGAVQVIDVGPNAYPIGIPGVP